MKPIEDFDPRPIEYRGTARDCLPNLLEKVHGEQLCISLLFDEKYRHWDTNTTPELEPVIADVMALRRTVEAFKASLAVSDDTIRQIEHDTWEQ